MKIGFIGLGRMGKNMVLHLLEQGIEVVAWNRSPDPLEEVASHGAIKAENLQDLVEKLENPRIIWVMMPAGEVTDQFINQLSSLVSKGDLIIDGANSYYKDTLKHFEQLNELGVHFMDIGVSGGPGGARKGACLMIGGSEEDYQKIKELAKLASAEGAYAHLGGIGAGHFAKMVHNGIEYGMMEAIAEGFAILNKSSFNFDLAKVANLYQKRSVIESRLVGWTEEALNEDPQLETYSSVIGRTGEGEWTALTAKELGVDDPVIRDSFNVRVNSETEPENFRNKVVSAMRGKFGGHSVKIEK